MPGSAYCSVCGCGRIVMRLFSEQNEVGAAPTIHYEGVFTDSQPVSVV